MKMFKYHRILIPILSFTNKDIALIFWSGLKGGQRQVILLCESAIDCLTRKTKTMKPSTERHSLMFSSPGPHERLQPHQHLLKGPHGRHRQSRRFLACTDNNFLLEVTEDPTRKGYAGPCSQQQGGASGEYEDKGQPGLLLELSSKVRDL